MAEPESGPDRSARPRRSELTPRDRKRRRAGQHTRQSAELRAAAGPDERDPTPRSGARHSRRTGARRPRRRDDPTPAQRKGAGIPPKRRGRRWLPVAVGGLLLVGIVLVAALVAGVFDEVLGRGEPVEPGAGPGGSAAGGSAAGDPQPSLVVVTHDESAASGRASGILVLAFDRDSGEGTILLVPASTVAEVAGYGSFPLQEAFALGSAALVEASLANLLGLSFDGTATITHEGWAELAERVGGVEVTVPPGLAAGAGASAQAAIEPGKQVLDGHGLVDYLAYRGESETELEALPRMRDVVVGILERVAAEPELLDEVFDDGAPPIETADTERVRMLLDELGRAQADDLVTAVTLPVATLGSASQDSYRLDAERARALVDERLAASRPPEGVGTGHGVQILNGNGVPGIGQQVAERLGHGGYRVVLSGNAAAFDHRTTRILIYGDSEEQLAVATDVRDRLGVGEIQRSESAQSVVDVTIVVGADFPP